MINMINYLKIFKSISVLLSSSGHKLLQQSDSQLPIQNDHHWMPFLVPKLAQF